VVEHWCVFFSQDGGASGLISIPSASYSQDVEFYPLFHIELLKLSQLLNCRLEVTVISNEDQLLLFFLSVWFPIGAKMNLHGPGQLTVVGVVVGQRQRERSSRHMK
jgi:hypothetical protein